MRKLKLIIFLAALWVAVPALAAEGEFDLGFARPGMMMGQFRFGAWPPGTAIYCSDDPDRPQGVGMALTVPRKMAEIGAVRCALLTVDAKGVWSVARRRIAGHPVEMTAMFGPDAQGTKRLAQLFLTAPREGYAGLVRHFVSRFGPPTTESERLVHRRSPQAEALVMHEEGDTALAMLIDSRLQEALNEKLGQFGRRQ